MGYLPGTLAALAAGRTVRAAELVFFDFLAEPMRYWRGAGPLRTPDGIVWEGTGGLGSISGLDLALGTAAPKGTFAIAGTDPRIIAVAGAQSSRVKGREVELYLQFFDEGWAPLDLPVSLWWGEMDRMTFTAAADGDTMSYTVSVAAEGAWTGRSRPAFGFWTDTDQQARAPGDRGLEQVPSLPGKTIRYPVY